MSEKDPWVRKHLTTLYALIALMAVGVSLSNFALVRLDASLNILRKSLELQADRRAP